MKKTVLLCVILALCFSSFAQNKDELEQLSATPKPAVNVPLDYKILLPRLEYKSWDDDFDQYYKMLTPALRKTQATMSFTENGVNMMINPNSIMPHAQLDTTIMIKDKSVLEGTWRMLVYRSMRFNDSVDIPTKKYYRLADTLLDNRSHEEAFIIFSGNQFKLFAKEAGKKDFKKMGASKYSVENNRYIMLYKLFKAGSGVSQMGIDKNGYLILNYPKVIEYVKKGEYISYYAVIEQYILQKVK